MTSKPDVTDFECCRTIIYQIVDLSLARRNQLLADRKISKKEYLNIGEQYEIPLRRQAKDLTIKIFDGILLPMAAFQSKIASVEDKLKKVIEQIQDYNQSIAFFSKIITFFGSVLSAASTGIAGIPTLLLDLQTIL
ncbi:MAG: hypothetical protein PUP90_17235 [Nostoc sp. S4]|nr:hypothetical protein [Nostoc sp. S4]